MPQISITGPVRGVYNAQAFGSIKQKLNDRNKIVGFIFLGDSNALYGIGSSTRKTGYSVALCSALDNLGYSMYGIGPFGFIVNGGSNANTQIGGPVSDPGLISSIWSVLYQRSGTAGFTGGSGTTSAANRSPINEMPLDMQPYCVPGSSTGGLSYGGTAFDAMHEGIWYRDGRHWWARFRNGMDIFAHDIGLRNRFVKADLPYRSVLWHMKGPTSGPVGFFSRVSAPAGVYGPSGSTYTTIYSISSTQKTTTTDMNVATHYVGYSYVAITDGGGGSGRGKWDIFVECQPYSSNTYGDSTTLTGPQVMIHQAVIAGTGVSGGYFWSNLLYQPGKTLKDFNDSLYSTAGLKGNGFACGSAWLNSYLQSCVDIVQMNVTAEASSLVTNGSSAGALVFVVNAGRNDMALAGAGWTGSYNYDTLEYDTTKPGTSGPSGYYHNARSLVNRIMGMTAIQQFYDGTNVKFILMPSHSINNTVIDAISGFTAASGITYADQGATLSDGYFEAVKDLAYDTEYGNYVIAANINELVTPAELVWGLHNRDHCNNVGFNLIMRRLFRQLFRQAGEYTGLENAPWGDKVYFEAIPSYLTPRERDTVIATNRGWEIPLVGATGITDVNSSYELLVAMRGLASKSLTTDRRGPIFDGLILDTSTDGFTSSNSLFIRSGIVSYTTKYAACVRLSAGEDVNLYSSYNWSATGATCSLTFGATHPSWLYIAAGPTYNTFLLTGDSTSLTGVVPLGATQQVDLVATSPQGITSGYTFLLRTGQ